jgi:DNA-3-methyladenine glycosylase
MAKKRRMAWLWCDRIKCSRPVAAGTQILGALPLHINVRFTNMGGACDDGRMPRRLTRAFFSRSVHVVAPDLIGALLLFDRVGGRIVEVEAYHHTEPAAHSFRGPTDRNAVMFGPPGYAYVYRSYGIHWCLNFVCEPKGSASAVLIRALAPSEGLAVMRRRRGMTDERLLCSGPGRLCAALRITGADDGLALDRPPFALYARTGAVEVVAGPRIGITKAADLPWRYGEKGSRFLSKPFVPAATVPHGPR